MDRGAIAGQASTLMISIFPENDKSSYFLVQEQSDDGKLCKIPLGYSEQRQLPGLMTLKAFVEGGSEVYHAKILVCIKSIGGRKACKMNFLTLLALLTIAKSHYQERIPGRKGRYWRFR